MLLIEYRNCISLTFKITIMSINHNTISVLGQVQNIAEVVSGYRKVTIDLLINQQYSIYHRHHHYYLYYHHYHQLSDLLLYRYNAEYEIVVVLANQMVLEMASY